MTTTTKESRIDKILAVIDEGLSSVDDPNGTATLNGAFTDPTGVWTFDYRGSTVKLSAPELSENGTFLWGIVIEDSDDPEVVGQQVGYTATIITGLTKL